MAIPRLSPWASARLPWSRFQPSSLKCRTLGFPQYGFKHQAPSSLVVCLPDSVGGLSPIPTYPTFRTSLLTPSKPPLSNGNSRLDVRGRGFNGSTWAQRSSLRSGYVVPPFNAWRPHPPVWFPPVHFPAELVIGPVFDIQGSSCLVARPSELSLLNSPGLPPSTFAGRSDVCKLPFFHAGAGHRIEGKNSWHLQYFRCN